MPLRAESALPIGTSARESSVLKAKVIATRDEAIDIKSFDLVSASGESLPPFTPGSHIDVHLAPGPVRQYSLCNGPNDTSSYRIAVKRQPDSRGGSATMHGAVAVGESIDISEPRNNFALKTHPGPALLVAGGIGITPILSMALHLVRTGRDFSLHYFTRSIAHTAFHDVLSQKRFLDKVAFHHAIEPDAIRAFLRKLLWHRAGNAELYLCDPRPFMDLVESTAAATWPPQAVHLENFSADSAALAGPRDTFTIPAGSHRRRPCRRCRSKHRSGPSRRRRRRRDELRTGRVRNLSDERAVGNAGPPGRLPHRRGARCRRQDHVLRVAREERDARAGHLKMPSSRDSTRCRPLRTAGFSMLRPPKGRFKMTHRLEARERADHHWRRADVPSLVRRTT